VRVAAIEILAQLSAGTRPRTRRLLPNSMIRVPLYKAAAVAALAPLVEQDSAIRAAIVSKIGHEDWGVRGQRSRRCPG